ncbi:phosphoribosyltransferase-like protein [Caenimonas aquaedulcis]|uniref:PRTase-CE domain-containing protein n=1 Tax=Caenimonas aquaedulcis TaxID=2793270 RepID=A0A931H4J2_9BURK|nr:hypothetical protein [Caenimonas aquaedulcis]MBG9388372.1 hypothetical protein [Caenimonas aquaedulcis]
MNDERQFTTPYLRGLDTYLRDELRNRRIAWGMGVEDFYNRVDAWFGNFAHADQPLALKVMLKLQHYSEPDFKRAIDNFLVPIQQYLVQTGSSLGDLRLVLPSERGDSADRHAYDIIKAWGLRQDQVVTVEDLARTDAGCVLVFFNDTHGTGNQFLREVFSKVRRENFKAVFLVAVTIAEKALLRFSRELKGIRLLPEVATLSIFDEFTAREVNRLRELGSQVYSKHPFGYGNAGLLVSYWFQCPNNTLPLIWANHKTENNKVDGIAFPWAPLFPYRPKATQTEPALPNVPSPESPDNSILNCDWTWSNEQRQLIVNQIEAWGLTSTAFYQTASDWFRNFKQEEREAALEIFFKTSYLNIAAIRSAIREIRRTLMVELGRVGGDMGDIVLVTTGDEKNSVYHYVYEFMREWHLSIDQVESLERLSPDRVIDKTLVFFYHTRPNGQHFEKHHAERLAKLTPRANVFAAYAMSSAAKKKFCELKVESPSVACSQAASRTMDTLVPGSLEVVSRIERELRPDSTPRDPANTFLSAYYFQCPENSSPLLWAEQSETEQRRRWRPLFRRIIMPSSGTVPSD